MIEHWATFALQWNMWIYICTTSIIDRDSLHRMGFAHWTSLHYSNSVAVQSLPSHSVHFRIKFSVVYEITFEWLQAIRDFANATWNDKNANPDDFMIFANWHHSHKHNLAFQLYIITKIMYIESLLQALLYYSCLKVLLISHLQTLITTW